MDIYLTGSLAYDRIMTFPGKFSDHILPEKIHILNVCFLVDGLEEKFGGTAGNIAYSLSMLGEKPVVLSQVGKDFEKYDHRINEMGLSVEGIRTVDHEFTAGAFITTDMSDNQITGFNPGAMKHSCSFDMTRIKPEDAVGIISPGCVEDMKSHPKYYRENGIPYIFDPGQQITAMTGEELAEALTGADILITNDYELELIMNATGLSRDDVLSRVNNLVTTLGEQGCIVVEDGEETRVPAAKAREVLDPTGAGDAFRAGMLKGMAMGRTLAESCRIGAVAAAYCVEQRGTQEHRYTWDEFTTRYEENFGAM
ncbi:carbohydrate kinase family protein [Salidesulfovibrio brasiliensis]